MNRHDFLKNTALGFSILGMVGVPIAMTLIVASLSGGYFQRGGDALPILMLMFFVVFFIPGMLVGGLVWGIMAKVLFLMKKEELESIIFTGLRIRWMERWNRFCMRILYGVDPVKEYGTLDSIFGEESSDGKSQLWGNMLSIAIPVVGFIVIMAGLGIINRLIREYIGA